MPTANKRDAPVIRTCSNVARTATARSNLRIFDALLYGLSGLEMTLAAVRSLFVSLARQDLLLRVVFCAFRPPRRSPTGRPAGTGVRKMAGKACGIDGCTKEPHSKGRHTFPIERCNVSPGCGKWTGHDVDSRCNGSGRRPENAGDQQPSVATHRAAEQSEQSAAEHGEQPAAEHDEQPAGLPPSLVLTPAGGGFSTEPAPDSSATPAETNQGPIAPASADQSGTSSMENSDSESVDIMPWMQLPSLTSSFSLPGIAIGQLLPQNGCLAQSWLEGMGKIHPHRWIDIKDGKGTSSPFSSEWFVGSVDQITLPDTRTIPAVTFVYVRRRQDNTNVCGGDTVAVPIPPAAEGDTLNVLAFAAAHEELRAASILAIPDGISYKMLRSVANTIATSYNIEPEMGAASSSELLGKQPEIAVVSAPAAADRRSRRTKTSVAPFGSEYTQKEKPSPKPRPCAAGRNCTHPLGRVSRRSCQSRTCASRGEFHLPCSIGVTEGEVWFCEASRDCMRARETFVKKNEPIRSFRLESSASQERPAPSDTLKADSVLAQARHEAELAQERLRSDASPYNSAPAYYGGPHPHASPYNYAPAYYGGPPPHAPSYNSAPAHYGGPPPHASSYNSAPAHYGGPPPHTSPYNSAHPHHGSLQQTAAGATVQMPSDGTNTGRQSH